MLCNSLFYTLLLLGVNVLPGIDMTFVDDLVNHLFVNRLTNSTLNKA